MGSESFYAPLAQRGSLLLKNFELLQTGRHRHGGDAFVLRVVQFLPAPVCLVVERLGLLTATLRSIDTTSVKQL